MAKQFSQKQLANQKAFAERMRNKKGTGAAASASTAVATNTSTNPAETKKTGYGIWIVLGIIVLGGVAYWYFTKDKK